MDQQLELKLDVKEAPAIPQYSGEFTGRRFHFSFLTPYRPPTEHWNISESEEEHQEQKGNESEFTTDSEMSDADEK